MNKITKANFKKLVLVLTLSKRKIIRRIVLP